MPNLLAPMAKDWLHLREGLQWLHDQITQWIMYILWLRHNPLQWLMHRNTKLCSSIRIQYLQYYLSPEQYRYGICVIIEQTCSQCLPNYIQNNNTCSSTSSSCLSTAYGVCSSCPSNLVLNGFACIDPIIIPSSCSLYDSRRGLCLICKLGWLLYKGACRTIQDITGGSSDGASAGGSNTTTTPTTTTTGRTSVNVPVTPMESIAMPNDILDGPTAKPIQYATLSLFGATPILTLDNCLLHGGGNNESRCVLCQDGYYLSQGICTLRQTCMQYQPMSPICSKCNQTLVLKAGQCIDINCATISMSNCILCNSGYSLNQVGVCNQAGCTKIVQGICMQCTLPYTLNNGMCITVVTNTTTDTVNNVSTLSLTNITNNSSTSGSTIANCLTYAVNGACSACVPRFYLSLNNTCIGVNPLCITYNTTTGGCLTCPDNYLLLGGSGKCIVSELAGKCEVANDNGYCNVCKSPYQLTGGSMCQSPVNTYCAIFNGTVCVRCLPYYYISNGICKAETLKDKDPNCIINDKYNYCQTCSANYYILEGGCHIKNPLCNTFDNTNGNCLSCYGGYILSAGNCIQSSIPNCKVPLNNTCLTCADRFILDTHGGCTAVNPLCNTYDNTTGACLSCYDGYQLSSGSCIAGSSKTNNNSLVISTQIAGCLTYNNLQCIACANGYFLTGNHSCIMIQFCQSYDSVNSRCVACIKGYYVNQQTFQCNAVSILCKDYDMKSGNCTSCNEALILQDGVCFMPAMGVDLHCVKYQNTYCIACADGYTLSNYLCQPNTTS